MQRFYGCHVSASGGVEQALLRGQILGVNAIQLHPSPPQRWNSKPFAAGTEARYLDLLPSSGVQRVFFHAIYLINLANPDPVQQQNSRKSLLNYLQLAERMSISGVIFHVGSMKDEPEEELGYRRAADAIDWVLSECPGKVPLIMEVSAGSGKIIGDKFEDLRTIYDLVKSKSRVGFGLDTQHMWASGYDLRSNLDTIVSEISSTFGMDKVLSIHLNDSKTECASNKDRHENLGAGLIGKDALEKFLHHPKLVNIPVILETPDLKDDVGAVSEVAMLRSLLHIEG